MDNSLDGARRSGVLLGWRRGRQWRGVPVLKPGGGGGLGSVRNHSRVRVRARVRVLVGDADRRVKPEAEARAERDDGRLKWELREFHR